LTYNDGTEIEREKFEQTNAELVKEFGATTTDTVVAVGHWLYQGVIYKDQYIRWS
jgi:hypothetical protein